MKTADPCEIAAIEALSVRLASLQMDQEQDQIGGRRRSRAAFRRWGERIPDELAADRDLEVLVDRHRDYWLRCAAGFVRYVDSTGLGSGDFHVVDTSSLGIAADGLAGFTMPDGFFDIVRDILPASARPGPVVAINVRGQAKVHSRKILNTANEPTIRESVLAGITATAIHEAAHAVDFQSLGLRLPEGATIEHLRLAVRPSFGPARSERHGANWVRAFAHLVFRSSVYPPYDYWSEVFRFDVADHYPGDAVDFLDALATEFISTSSAEPLVDVLARPAPAAFQKLAQARGASRPS